MSRSGYSDDYNDDQWALIRWRGAVASSIKGARGQAFLRELAATLDAMPEKKLASGSFKTADGEFCTLGVIANARGVDVSGIDPDGDECREPIARMLAIAPALAAEIMYENDESIGEFRWVDVEICGPMHHWDRRLASVRVPNDSAAHKRWQYMRAWVGARIAKPSDGVQS